MYILTQEVLQETENTLRSLTSLKFKKTCSLNNLIFQVEKIFLSRITIDSRTVQTNSIQDLECLRTPQTLPITHHQFKSMGNKIILSSLQPVM
jgi:hypothetical protein